MSENLNLKKERISQVKKIDRMKERLKLDLGCWVNKEVYEYNDTLNKQTYKIQCLCGNEKIVKYSGLIRFSTIKPNHCELCIKNGREIKIEKTNHSKEKFNKLKDEVLAYTHGDISVISVDDPTNSFTLSNCFITTHCKKCNNTVKKEYFSFTSWQRRNKDRTESGCQICNSKGLNSNLEIGLVSHNRTLVDIIKKDELKKSLQDAKFVLKCNWCGENSDYCYGKATAFFLNPKFATKKITCPKCRYEGLEDKNYLPHIGKTFGIFTVIDVITKNQCANNIIFKTKCKCGAIHEKTLVTLRHAKKRNFKTCSVCKPTTVNRIFDKDMDLTGKEINIFTVVKYIGNNAKQNRVWDCVCRCGAHSEITTGRLSLLILYPNSTCIHCKNSVLNNYKIGSIYKNRKILDMDDDYNGNLTYLCLNCGDTHVITKSAWSTYIRLKDSVTCKTCKNITHGDSREGQPIYNFYIRWITLKTKIANKELEFDPRWEDYLKFKEDMYETFDQVSSLKCTSNYWSKDTCYWETDIKKIKGKENNS